MDDSFVYWSDGHANALFRTSRVSGHSELLAHNAISIGPVVDAKHLYHGVILPPPRNTFEIRMIAKSPR
jgi:hypothetical protein